MGNICCYVMNNLFGNSLAKDGLFVSITFLFCKHSHPQPPVFSSLTKLFNENYDRNSPDFKSKNLQNLDTQTFLGKSTASSEQSLVGQETW